MKTFINDDFLLQSPTARALYHDYAREQPIFDYHCHLSPKEIAENLRFKNLAQAWLAGDHYKWRGMRANGVAEKYCTGDAPDYEKFMAYARSMPRMLLNPLYHWTHLELLRFFGIDDILDGQSAPEIWAKTGALLARDEYSARGLITRSKVKAICTTDDPVDDLGWHRKIRADETFKTRVYPTFRPDKALTVNSPAVFNAWVNQLESASGLECVSFHGFLRALEQRHQYFHEHGCRLSDQGLNACPRWFATDSEARRVFDDVRAGRSPSAEDAEKFSGFMLLLFGRLDAQKGWTKQLHLGPLRNNSSRLLRAVGADAGGDSMGDERQAVGLSRYLDLLDADESLPKTILYNLNPSNNYLFATMAGNFQDGTTAGKIQFGGGWWFLDQKEGMEWQMSALAHNGLLSRFVGMLTDSRSFLSYTRHEYFRRILCNLIGGAAERGEVPDDIGLLGGMVSDICFNNAKNYFGMELAD
ncbi:MAG: glucuronate isomerase [Verrucomicrobiales bacterium]|jgi:glucuronate isomerase|nr:glucuronate isomerase [Verrucomicrobiales bacterium]